MTFYCPKCWSEIPENAGHCPVCSYDLSAYESLSYEDKMIFALSHPIRENRLMAIEALGRLQDSKAVPHLAALLKQDEDYYVLREALLALSRIDTEDAWALIQGAAAHESTLVSHYAERLVSGHS